MDLLTFFSTYLYFTGAILYFFVFIVLFLWNKESRKEMLLVGGVCGVAGLVLSNYALKDYWHPLYVFPSFRLEDFIYGFSFGGFSSECSDLFFQHKIKKHKKRLHILFTILFFTFCTFTFFLYLYKVNSIISHFLPLLFVGLISIMISLKNLKYQLVSGLTTCVITVLIFQILINLDPNFIFANWKTHNLTNIYFMRMPIEEHIFAFLMGFGLASFYKITSGLDRK